MNAPKWKLVAVKTVKHASYNPKRRIEDAAVSALADSMSKYGLLYPILIDENNTIIDGHRRAAAAKMLGWETIQAIVATGDRDAIYASVNSTGKRMSGNDALGVWMVSPAAVTSLQAIRFKAMEDVIGRELVKKMHESGMSLKLYNLARQISNYCDGGDELVVASIKWLLEIPVAGRVQKAMAHNEISIKTLIKAIETKKPIKMQATIAA
jgi:ParB-like chromosome segregation protein Spo0J